MTSRQEMIKKYSQHRQLVVFLVQSFLYFSFNKLKAHSRCVYYFVCCGSTRTNENTGMLSIDILIFFYMLMILFKFYCSWSYFVGMQANILKKIIYNVESFLQATGSRFLGFSLSLFLVAYLCCYCFFCFCPISTTIICIFLLLCFYSSPLFHAIYPFCIHSASFLWILLLFLFPSCVKGDCGFSRMEQMKEEGC